MHELSIADSLAQQVAQHTPAGHRVLSLRLRIGARQGVDPDSLKWSWEMVSRGTSAEGSRMEIELLPWQFCCPQCGRRWEGEELLVACACGCATPSAEASAELTLLSLDVEELEPAAPAAGEHS